MTHLAAWLTHNAELRVGDIDENTVVLLLEGGDDVKNGVDAGVRGSCHGEAWGGAGGAADEEIVLGEAHVQPGEHERYRRHAHRNGVAGVEAAQWRQRRVAHLPPDLISHCRVSALHKYAEHRTCTSTNNNC